MKIGIIQASSQKSKNSILEKIVKQTVKNQDIVINFGIYDDSPINLSYVQISLAIALLINTKSIDFIISGCSSGQGMMLACNTFPNIQCGYLPTAEDAFLFAQINHGNTVSIPLGLNWGWAGELKVKNIIRALFSKKFGQGYPPQDAQRKLKNTDQVQKLNSINKVNFVTALSQYDKDLLLPVLNYDPVYHYLVKNGQNRKLVEKISSLKQSLNK